MASPYLSRRGEKKRKRKKRRTFCVFDLERGNREGGKRRGGRGLILIFYGKKRGKNKREKGGRKGRKFY